MTGQRKGIPIAMTDGERDAFLRTQPVCRVATVGPADRHVSALWFVWDGTELWLNSLTRSQRWADVSRDPRLSVIVDEGGADFLRLRGVELRNGSSPASTCAAAASGTTVGTAGSGSPSQDRELGLRQAPAMKH
jgi:hypothetical protein